MAIHFLVHTLKILKIPSRTKEIDVVEDLDPYDHADDGCWHIKLLPAFDGYYLKIQHQPEYQEFTGKNAKGKITITNRAMQEWALRNKTQFQTPDGIIFRIQKIL